MPFIIKERKKKYFVSQDRPPNCEDKHQAAERRRKKKNPLGIKITFPGLAPLAVSYNLRNSFSPELFWVLRNKIRQNVPVEFMLFSVR